MIVKELKKIVFSKIILVLLASLCIVNILYETRTNTETKEQIATEEKVQNERIENYTQFLEKVEEDGINMQSFSLFSENNKFQVENAKKTVKAYKAVKSVKPVYGNYKVIEKVTEFGLTDIILFIMIVQMALVLIGQEMKKGMLELLKSCKNGRINLILNKIAALSIMSAVVMAIVYGIKFVQLYIKFGLDNISVPIQSVRGFYECNLPIEIWQYMILYFLLKWIVISIIGITVIGIISFSKNEMVTYGIIFICTSMSLLISNGVEWNMSTAIFRMLSPATLLNTKSFTAQYININVFQHPFELFKWSIIIIFFYLVTGIIYATFSFITKKRIALPNVRLIRNKRKKGIKTRGILSYEGKKIFAVNKVALFILILVVIQGYFLSNDDTKLDYDDRCYAKYISNVYGVPDEDSQKYLDTEQKRYDEIEAEYAQLTDKFIMGQIDSNAYALAQQEYNALMLPYPAFQEVQQKNDYLKTLKQERNIEGWFTNDLAFQYIFDENILYDKDISFLILFIVAVFCIVPVFTYDKQKEMLKLLDTTYYGRSRLIKNKYISSIVLSIVLWGIEAIPWLIIVLKVYTPDGLQAPAQSLIQLQNFPLHISILGALVIFYICKCIGMILLGLLVVGISAFVDDYIKNVAISLGIIVMPVLLYILGVEFLNQVLFMPMIKMSDYFTGATVVEWINLIVVVLGVILLNIRNLRSYKII